MIVTVIITGGGQVLVDVEKILEPVLAEVEGVGVVLGDVVVVVIGFAAPELDGEDVSADGVVVEAGSGEVDLLLVEVVVVIA